MNTIRSLADTFPEEQARLREIQGYCRAIGDEGNLLFFILESILVRADKAVMEQDTVAMIRIYEEMKDIHE